MPALDADVLLDGLNSSQVEAVTAPATPLLVVAGPGSGKTRVLTHRMAYLSCLGADPSRLLAVTFTNKAAAELRERLGALLGPAGPGRPWVGTFHAVALRLLRRHPSAAGLPEGFTVVPADDARRLVRACLAELGAPCGAAEARDAHAAISRAKSAGLSPEAAAGLDQFRHAAEVYDAYQRALRRAAGVDFDDLLLSCVGMLDADEVLRARYRDFFAHVLVDEFQDTNEVQYRMLRLLAVERVSVVGDPAQSIYSWRGSRPQVMDDFQEDFAPVRSVLLAENYRSTPQIVQACQRLLRGSPDERDLLSCNPDGAPVGLVAYGDDREEAVDVAARVRSLPAGESAAVLMRTNAQTRGLEEALVRAGVPYAVVGSLRFYERAEVRDALAYLRVAVNDADVLSLGRVYNTPRRGLGPAAWDGIAEQAARLGSVTAALEALSVPGAVGRAARGVASLREAVENVRAHLGQGPAAALDAVLEQAGLREAVSRLPDGAERVENLGELLSAARQFAAAGSDAVTVEGALVSALHPAEQVRAFLESTALASGADASESGARVVLSTAHAAKGREFDHVFVVGVEDGLFPHVSSSDFAEERRLLFVAMSRARHALTVSWCRSRLLFGSRSTRSPSPFLAALGSAVPGSPVRAVRPPRVASPVQRLTSAQAMPGALVQHPLFGPGEVLEADGLVVTVDFAGTSRQLRLDVAPLSLLRDAAA